MKAIHTPTEESLASGTMKFHLRAATAFEKYGRKADAKTAKKAAEMMRDKLNKLENQNSTPKCIAVGCKCDSIRKAQTMWGKFNTIGFCDKHTPDWLKSLSIGESTRFYKRVE